MIGEVRKIIIDLKNLERDFEGVLEQANKLRAENIELKKKIAELETPKAEVSE